MHLEMRSFILPVILLFEEKKGKIKLARKLLQCSDITSHSNKSYSRFHLLFKFLFSLKFGFSFQTGFAYFCFNLVYVD